MKKDIKLRIIDWWLEDTQENFYNNVFVQMLQDKFNVIYAEKPDFIIYGPFGFEHLKYDCVRIFYSGENARPDYNIADYSIDFDYQDFGDRHFRSLDILFRKDLDSILYKHEKAQQYAESKSKFCGFMVTNAWQPFTDMREECFSKLNAYKRVDSAGRHNNNVGYYVDDKLQWLKSYKFNLCFENSSYPGYLTEKIFDAFAAGCIPIYWGDTSLRLMDLDSIESSHINGGGGGNHTLNNMESNSKDSNFETNKVIESSIKDSKDFNLESSLQAKNSNLDSKNLAFKNIKIDTRLPHISQDLINIRLNPKAFINAHNFPDLDSLINEVKRIDNDKDAYLQMLKEPVFLTDIEKIKSYKEKLKAFLESIFAQSPQDAFRRGRGQWLSQREQNLHKILAFDKEMKKIEGLPTLLRYYKFAKFINDTLTYRLIFRDSIKRLKAFLKPKSPK